MIMSSAAETLHKVKSIVENLVDESELQIALTNIVNIIKDNNGLIDETDKVLQLETELHEAVHLKCCYEQRLSDAESVMSASKEEHKEEIEALNERIKDEISKAEAEEKKTQMEKDRADEYQKEIARLKKKLETMNTRQNKEIALVRKMMQQGREKMVALLKVNERLTTRIKETEYQVEKLRNYERERDELKVRNDRLNQLLDIKTEVIEAQLQRAEIATGKLSDLKQKQKKKSK